MSPQTPAQLHPGGAAETPLGVRLACTVLRCADMSPLLTSHLSRRDASLCLSSTPPPPSPGVRHLRAGTRPGASSLSSCSVVLFVSSQTLSPHLERGPIRRLSAYFFSASILPPSSCLTAPPVSARRVSAACSPSAPHVVGMPEAAITTPSQQLLVWPSRRLIGREGRLGGLRDNDEAVVTAGVVARSSTSRSAPAGRCDMLSRVPDEFGRVSRRARDELWRYCSLLYVSKCCARSCSGRGRISSGDAHSSICHKPTIHDVC